MPFDPRTYIKLMFYSIVFILVCTYLFANENGDLSGNIYPVSVVNTSEGTIKVTRDEDVMSQNIKERWVTPDGQWCFVTVIIKQEGDNIIKKEELHCSDTNPRKYKDNCGLYHLSIFHSPFGFKQAVPGRLNQLSGLAYFRQYNGALSSL